MSIQLRAGVTTEDPRLDFIPYKDERSRNFAAVEAIAWARPKFRNYFVRRWLDQGQEGACVGYAFSHELVSTPLRISNWRTLDDEFARERVYWEAQKIDPWEGGAYPGAKPFYEGTSILAGVKTIKKMGFIDEYRWAFGEEDLALAVGHLGPAVIGVNWYEGMFAPDRNNYIEPTGRLQGGHAILVCGVNPRTGYYRLWNSWGKSWGRNGWCYITREDMDKLLKEDGEACIPLKRNVEERV